MLSKIILKSCINIIALNVMHHCLRIVGRRWIISTTHFRLHVSMHQAMHWAGQASPSSTSTIIVVPFFKTILKLSDSESCSCFFKTRIKVTGLYLLTLFLPQYAICTLKDTSNAVCSAIRKIHHDLFNEQISVAHA